MSYDRTRLTLGELLTSDDVTIKRNAMSILKVMTGCDHKFERTESGTREVCIYCLKSRLYAPTCTACHGKDPEGCTYCSVEGTID